MNIKARNLSTPEKFIFVQNITHEYQRLMSVETLLIDFFLEEIPTMGARKTTQNY